ncbi:ParE toxin of type II toxin-antitoxin system, parDE [uncultured archaeon]|nr:ParE toxin of type II toxin-antitoxin system, parDE [uncultured archaeon]
MNYEIIFDDETIKFLENLQHDLKEQIFNKLLSTKDNPHYFFERLSQRTDYKLRIGDYRVIAEIDDTNKRITITLIGHRRNVYK